MMRSTSALLVFVLAACTGSASGDVSYVDDALYGDSDTAAADTVTDKADNDVGDSGDASDASDASDVGDADGDDGDDDGDDGDDQLSDPTELTLTGFTGAGTRSHTTPVWFENFTTTEDGASVTEVGYQRASGYELSVDMSDGLDALSGSLRWNTGEGGDVGDGVAEVFPHVYNDLPAGTTTVIRAYYIKVVKTRSTSGSTGNMQLKSFRTGATSDDDNVPHYSGQPVYKTSLWLNAEEGDFVGVYSSWEGVGDVESTQSLWSEAVVPTWHVGEWNYLKAIFVQNTVGSDDGRLEYWVNGAQVLNRTDCAPRTSANQYLEYIQLLPGFDFKLGDEWSVSYANDYIDTDLARVELTNSATYDASTKWAMQPVLAWSDDSITIKLNTVGFGDNDLRFYHIFDSSGAHVAVVSP